MNILSYWIKVEAESVRGFGFEKKKLLEFATDLKLTTLLILLLTAHPVLKQLRFCR
jgi:hypothetical protein